MFKLEESNVNFGIRKHPNNSKWAIITGKVMFGNSNLFNSEIDPIHNKEGDYYSQIVIPKDKCDMAEYKTMFDAAISNGKIPKEFVEKYKNNHFNNDGLKFFSTVRDGDNLEGEWKQGNYILKLTAKRRFKPSIFASDAKTQLRIEDGLLGHGDVGIFLCNIFSWHNEKVKNSGVKLGLLGVQYAGSLGVTPPDLTGQFDCITPSSIDGNILLTDDALC